MNTSQSLILDMKIQSFIHPLFVNLVTNTRCITTAATTTTATNNNNNNYYYYYYYYYSSP